MLEPGLEIPLEVGLVAGRRGLAERLQRGQFLAEAVEEELYDADGGVLVEDRDQDDLLGRRTDRRDEELPRGAAVMQVRRLFAWLAPQLPADHVQQGRVDALPWPDGSMDAVISSAVLHFARDAAHFDAMVGEMWRVLAPGGLLFARLATSIGIAHLVDAPVGRQRLPDGSERFIVDERTLLSMTDRRGGELLDPLKTTNVQNMRAMTTWAVLKLHDGRVGGISG